MLKKNVLNPTEKALTQGNGNPFDGTNADEQQELFISRLGDESKLHFAEIMREHAITDRARMLLVIDALESRDQARSARVLIDRVGELALGEAFPLWEVERHSRERYAAIFEALGFNRV
ncbi:hypothetical protein [Desulfurivibrio dismutans]|uniref:hypothetical protein n=1 Tax=Desulfurivibrio dismutans TaxID=1398908 RepID=UPI0023DC2C6C|nr:hypothetical protein [Desulfurivibrio alkaliphilus]MDF1613653.1 hypothetical protein [Desulfurivibrio alkaliphilus]